MESRLHCGNDMDLAGFRLKRPEFASIPHQRNLPMTFRNVWLRLVAKSHLSSTLNKDLNNLGTIAADVHAKMGGTPPGRDRAGDRRQAFAQTWGAPPDALTPGGMVGSRRSRGDGRHRERSLQWKDGRWSRSACTGPMAKAHGGDAGLEAGKPAEGVPAA